jgi:hypothetical protein
MEFCVIEVALKQVFCGLLKIFWNFAGWGNFKSMNYRLTRKIAEDYLEIVSEFL